MGRVQGDQDLGPVVVLQLHQHLGEAAEIVVEGRRFRKAGVGDADRDGLRGGPGLLLAEAPEVGLDMDDHRLVEGRALLHQELELGVIGRHGRGILQFRVGILAAGVRGGAAELIIIEDGDHALAVARGHVETGELARRAVPGRPAGARIHAPGKVLGPVSERNRRGIRPGQVEVGDAQLEIARQGGGDGAVADDRSRGHADADEGDGTAGRAAASPAAAGGSDRADQDQCRPTGAHASCPPIQYGACKDKSSRS